MPKVPNGPAAEGPNGTRGVGWRRAACTRVERLSVRHETQDRYRIEVRGHRIVVDQTIAAGGGDEGPTPTELFVSSLASCVAFYAGRFLRRHGVPEGDLAVECEFAMSAEPPWRVESVAMDLVLPADLPDEVKSGALRAADHCTVHNSINVPPKIRVRAASREHAR